MIERAPVTKAVRHLLETVTGRPCGLTELPLVRDKLGQLVPAPAPYSVLDPVGTTLHGPPFGDSTADATLTYQITIVGDRADQVEWLADRARRTILGRTSAGAWEHELGVPHVAVMDRHLVTDGGTQAEGTTVISVLRISLELTPAP